MSKIKYVILILIIALGGYLIFFDKGSKGVIVDNSSSISEGDDLDVTGEEDILVEENSAFTNEESDFFIIKYELSGINEDGANSDIARFVEGRVSQFKNESGFENLTEEDKETLGFNRGMKYTLDFSYDLKESDYVKSYILKTAVFTGGAHGNLELISFNYDKETGKRLGLNNIFTKSASEYLPALSAFGINYFKEKFPEFFVLEGLKPEPLNWSVWYTENDSIVFIFQTYQVVPYAYGTPEMFIKTENLSKFINEEYFAN